MTCSRRSHNTIIELHKKINTRISNYEMDEVDHEDGDGDGAGLGGGVDGDSGGGNGEDLQR